MSKLQQIITSDSRTGQWESIETRYIYEINFADRKSAEAAFLAVQPHYYNLWASGTWKGIEATQNKIPEYAETSHHSDMWVDENNHGFSLCISFSNIKQRDEIRKKLRPFFKDNQIKHHAVTINERERLRLDDLDTVTHSVELDVSNSVLTLDVVTDFMNVAMTMLNGKKPVYIDTIGKDGFRRLKAYFRDKTSALDFAKVCDDKIRKPLVRLQEGSVVTPQARKFLNPIQDRMPQVA